MATTPGLVGDRPSPMDAIDEALRTGEKRRRVETEEGESAEELPGPVFPPDVQMEIVRAVERSHRDEEWKDQTRFLGVTRWFAAYTEWQKGRTRQMEHPRMLTLQLARLFVSPRFKLVTSMQPSAAEGVLEAYSRAMQARLDLILIAQRDDLIRPPTSHILILGRSKSSMKWSIIFLKEYSGRPERTRGEKDPLFETDIMGDTMGDTIQDATPVTHRTDSGRLRFEIDQRSFGKRFLDDVIFYGVIHHLHPSPRRNHHWTPLQSLFAHEAFGATKPTQELLAWRNKIVVAHVLARPVQSLLIRFEVHYELAVRESPPHPGTYVSRKRDKIIEVMVHESRREGRKSFAMMSIGEFATEARQLGDKEIGYISEFDTWNYVKTTVSWIEFADPVTIHTARGRPEFGGFAVPKDTPMLDGLAEFFRTAPLPPGLQPLDVNRNAWNYDMTMHLRTLPRWSDVWGLVMMPAPWFFYLLRRSPRGTFVFPQAKFEFNLSRVHVLALEDPYIYAHQPYEMIFLPDDIRDIPLESLTLLQSKSLSERASAPLVDEIEDGIKLM